jgi:hypothetical protein
VFTRCVYARLQHHCQVMALPTPNITLVRFVRQGCQREAAICKAYFFDVIAENAIRGFDEHSFMLRYSLPPGFFDAGHRDELVNFGHTSKQTANCGWSLVWTLLARTI